jgi:predicted RNA polymerase sigma factor
VRKSWRRGFYALQAAIVACHARAPTAAATDWTRIAALYAELASLAPSPVIDSSIAPSRWRWRKGPLDIVDGWRRRPALKCYHLLPGVRGASCSTW